MPILTTQAKLPEIEKEKEKPALTIDPSKMADKDNDDSRSSICLSPSWDNGKKAKKEKKQLEKEKKKLDEARKEAEKKAKKEAEKQRAAADKAGKREGRLSKRPPPAAMETQRMPSALRDQSGSRRNSMLSMFSSGPSADSSRRSSRDLKRLSIASTDSSRGQRRSRSTPASSTEIEDPSEAWRASGVAPQLPALPRFSLHSRSGSSAGSKSDSWGSDEAYGRELAKRANQLNKDSDANQSLQPTRPLLRTHTDTALLTISQEQPVLKEVTRAVAERKRSDDGYWSRKNGDRMDLQNGHTHGIDNANLHSNAAQASASDRSAAHKAQKASIHPQQANPNQMFSTLNGGSYVHQERMRKQQQSLRSWNDEQAIKDATRVLEDDSEDAPQDVGTAQVENVESDAQEANVADDEKEEIIPPVPSIPAAQEDSRSSTESADQYHNYLKGSQDARESIALATTDSMTPKRHTFLGMGFRSKAVKQSKHSPLAENTSRSSEDTVSDTRPSQPPRLDTNNLNDSQRPSKAERMLGRGSPQTPPTQGFVSGSRLSQAVVDKERSPTGKTSSPTQGRVKLANAIVDKESPLRRNATAAVEAKMSVSKDGSTILLESVSREATVQTTPLVRSHSRTRTSSSQLLNDNVSPPRLLPRSTTAPVLPTFNPEPFNLHNEELPPPRMSNIQDNVQPKQASSSTQSKTTVSTTERNTSPAKQVEKTQSEKPASKPVPELVIEDVKPEGIVRKTSLKRPRSNPQLQATSPTPPVPRLDFLPPLKHQALVKPKPRSQLRNSITPDNEPTRPSSSQFPVPAAPAANNARPLSNSAPNLVVTPPLSPNKRPTSQLSPSASSNNALIPRRPPGPATRLSGMGGRPSAGLSKTVAKIIVTCCSCTRWIDLPSDLFEAMAMPARLTKLDGSAAGMGGEGRLDTAVQCPWCRHCMTTRCCSTDTWICNKHNEY